MVNKKIAIIIGHDKESQGAANKETGTTEYKFNGRLAELISRELLDFEYEPIIIERTSGYSKLSSLVNDKNPSIAISLHCNAVKNKKINGTETLFYVGSKKGRSLAGKIQHQIVKCLGFRDRGLKPCQYKYKGNQNDRGGYLLKKTNMPCVILEPFFITNNKALEITESKMADLARAISAGVVEYMSEGEGNE